MLTVLPFPWLLNLDLGPKVRGEVRKHLRPAFALKMVSPPSDTEASILL